MILRNWAKTNFRNRNIPEYFIQCDVSISADILRIPISLICDNILMMAQHSKSLRMLGRLTFCDFIWSTFQTRHLNIQCTCFMYFWASQVVQFRVFSQYVLEIDKPLVIFTRRVFNCNMLFVLLDAGYSNSPDGVACECLGKCHLWTVKSNEAIQIVEV